MYPDTLNLGTGRTRVDEGFITFGEDGVIVVTGRNASVVAAKIVQLWNAAMSSSPTQE
jgi:hypothetical protein